MEIFSNLINFGYFAPFLDARLLLAFSRSRIFTEQGTVREALKKQS